LKHRIEHALLSAPFSGGVQMGVTWKKQLSLTMDWTFLTGVYSMNNDRYFLENNMSGGFMMLNRSKKLMNEWRNDLTDEEKAKVTAPKYDEDMVIDDRLLENSSFLRLKNIQLAYTFPKSVFGTQKVITGAKVYVSARNLLTVTSKEYNGFDPETSAGGLTMNKFPNTRQFVGGIQLMF
ncbi:MAG: TonB-dependent receptor, partial [Porphyromonas endodontalis]